MGGLEVRLTGLRSLLCLGAHADDIEIGCGGTVQDLLESNPGLQVHWVVLSAQGERADEARDSTDKLLANAGLSDVRIGDFAESCFPYLGRAVKDYVAGLGAEIAPDLILTHWRGDLHQDHRLVSELTWNTFRDHLILEYEIPKWDGDMGRPNTYVPLDRARCERKIDHLLSVFPSQANKDWFAAEVFWGLLRLRGMEARSPSGYAEAFHCHKLVLS
ncbi:MAG: GlcNAc-PI de-N-acetylase [Actinobacteria bacterium RBG_16_64_13]|nr:MAG: GlcNAc-PI de-N-acetylase [Actinobacteria bacterium RBG_16_64_13]